MGRQDIPNSRPVTSVFTVPAKLFCQKADDVACHQPARFNAREGEIDRADEHFKIIKSARKCVATAVKQTFSKYHKAGMAIA